MFGRDKKRSPEPPVEIAPARDPEGERRWFNETLARLEREYVEEYGPKQPEWHALYVADHEADCAGFSWRFERYGDFLMLAISRRNAKWAQSINLNDIRAIEWTAGAPPRSNGKLFLHTGLVGSEASAVWSFPHVARKEIVPPEGLEYYAVGPLEPSRRRQRLHIGMIPINERVRPIDDFAPTFSIRPYEHPIPSDFSAMAEPARDGYILFYGPDMALPCPAGLENQVHADLLAEIRDGWEKKPILSNNGEDH